MRRALGIAAASLPLVFAAALYYFLQLVLAEDLTVGEHSIAAYMLIHEELVRDFPRIDLTASPSYYYSAGDGPKPPANGISYESSAEPGALMRAAEDYLESRGFTRDPVHTEQYHRREQLVTLRVLGGQAPQASRVVLTAYQ